MLSFELQASVNSSSNNKLQNAPEFKNQSNSILTKLHCIFFFVLNRMSVWMGRVCGWVITA